jgi:hypothetical protein|uniref:Uncharacterized protein n=1 Tax=viral metagenome TaxID=1070528 RepID=A0A6C0LXJ5_9ZZZZ
MGLLRAIITLVISITILNLILRYKESLEKYPILRHFVPLLEEKKCYILIGIMLILMIIW